MSAPDVSARDRAAARVAVVIPCRNEAHTVGQVVSGFRRALPQATLHVFDNASSDGTAAAALAAGAQVHAVPRPGKGRLLAAALLTVDADVYVLVDGDATYDATLAPALLARIHAGCSLVVASRRQAYAGSGSRTGHRSGNRAITALVNLFFGEQLHDVLSGYRVFSRRFARTLPGLSEGFEVEVMMTLHALEIGARVEEVEGDYRPRPADSVSKLRTVPDGARIVWTLLYLVKQVRPFLLFGGLALLLFVLATALGLPLLQTYLETGLVPRFPTAILVAGIGVAASVSLAIGLILDSVSVARRELKRVLFQMAGD